MDVQSRLVTMPHSKVDSAAWQERSSSQSPFWHSAADKGMPPTVYPIEIADFAYAASLAPNRLPVANLVAAQLGCWNSNAMVCHGINTPEADDVKRKLSQLSGRPAMCTSLYSRGGKYSCTVKPPTLPQPACQIPGLSIRATTNMFSFYSVMYIRAATFSTVHPPTTTTRICSLPPFFRPSRYDAIFLIDSQLQF
jgi:hypothetical protein